MPPSASADNGGFAWMITIRPREYSMELESSVHEFITEGLNPTWWLGVREKGNHSHWAVFLDKGQQRSNLITRFLNNPLKGYDEAEAKNFRRYDKETKTAAVLNMTTLGMVAEYLSGEFDKKLDDEYEVISEHLPPPEDISELEEYLPAVDGLKRKRQISVWYATQKIAYDDRKFTLPATERSVLEFLNHRMYVWKDMDILADQRILKQKVRALVRYMNSDGTASYTDHQLLDEDSMMDAQKAYQADTKISKLGPWSKPRLSPRVLA